MVSDRSGEEWVAEKLGFWRVRRREVNGQMSHSWAKNRATSRRAGSRRDVTESLTWRRCDVRGNVATWQRARPNNVATCGATSRRGREPDQMTSRRGKMTSRRENSTSRLENSTSRRDRELYSLTSRRNSTRRDVIEEC